ncbi:hypothetical protein BGZ61DRAFT_27895 [Ilyonectria robusta]|uniref:uncharacterized protein n=1 Tax=Ilyonectria robusta TaxID=1079257 RepID=UPI001E8E1AA3|nr:uncharacterized protein BGZ61DRAFT_27895 [Ilyonectria robusta]KAH8738098.1 hypothetical protein BGZ61DRAFT_27895 [Ilyonectria robusta]
MRREDPRHAHGHRTSKPPPSPATQTPSPQVPPVRLQARLRSGSTAISARWKYRNLVRRPSPYRTDGCAHQNIHLRYGIMDNPIPLHRFTWPQNDAEENSLTPPCVCPSPTKLNFDEFTLHSELVARLLDQDSTPATCQPAPSMLLIHLRQMASATLRGFGRWHGLSTPNMNEAKSRRGAGSPPTN